eukprot:TRINITY_DN19042_c0_g1_i1.p1 TRINITY_DN19042_c0_g1~~TRINITY_DN19042_c0_g1_i1.p1  ORF type:complete len:354 (+),score=41.84 TRINITY_DN19042_c0_g1_i1:141-1202(+)
MLVHARKVPERWRTLARVVSICVVLQLRRSQHSNEELAFQVQRPRLLPAKHSLTGVRVKPLEQGCWRPVRRSTAASDPHGKLPTSSGPVKQSSLARSVARFIFAGIGVFTALLMLLYVTSGMELLMEKLFQNPLAGKSPVVAMVIGLAVGALHTVAGPDHLAALAPLVIGQRRSPVAAFGLGALWGSGHATGQLLIGLGCLAVHIGLMRVPWAAALSQASGLLVGLSLIAIGLLGFKEAQDYSSEDEGQDQGAQNRFSAATYATGVVHGLSLDAIVFIMPAFSLPRLAAAVHVLGVVAGTLFSMGCYTGLLSMLCRKSPQLKLVSAGASSIALILGVTIVMSSFGIRIPLPGL